MTEAIEADVQTAKAMYDWQHGAGAWDSSQSMVRDHYIGLARAALAAINQEAWVAALLNAPNPEQALAATPAVGGEALDRETIQTLLDLLNPLHGALDYQIHINSEGEHVYDAPPDYEHHVIVLAQQDRDLTQAVLILENRRAAPASPLRGRDTLATLIREYARDLRRNSSGGDDYPWEYAKGTADYLEVLIGRAAAPPEQPASLPETLKRNDRENL